MKDNFEERRREYGAAIERELDEGIGKSEGELYQTVTDAMRYAALGGGKRLRGMLTLEFCRLGCGEYSRALPFAGAIEMIHAYSLIHDDLPCMDNDVLRRGKPTCHVQFGEANALLAGDGLLTRAFESALSRCDWTRIGYERGVRALSLLAQMAGADGMVGGQVIDLRFEKEGGVTIDILRRLHALKTGALIRAACGMGALVGGMDEKRIELADRYARELGLAFQIVDDVLDETSTPEELGKSIGKDKKSGKTTYVTLYGIEGAMQLAHECTGRAEGLMREMGIEDGFLLQLTRLVAERRS